MKKCIVLFLAVTIVFTTQQSIASDDARAADHETLRALKTNVEHAINSENMAELRKLLAKDFTLIMADQVVLKTAEDITKYWNDYFHNEQSPVRSMEIHLTADILTQFLSPNTGFCHGTSMDIYTLKNKRKVAISSNWSAIVIKEGESWKIQSAHAGVNYLDNPVLAMKTMPWYKKLAVALGLAKFPGETD